MKINVAREHVYDVLCFDCLAIDTCGKFLQKHTGYGEDVSPEFIIHNLSPEAETIAIVLEDVKHHIFGILTHWIIWNIPAKNVVPEGIPRGKTLALLGGACQGVAYGMHKYAGPKPPKGKSHRYRFTLYALDCNIVLKTSARKKHLLQAIGGCILQQGVVIGEYE